MRRIPIEGKTIRAWYLCDLKVHPDWRGQRIPGRLFRRNLLGNYLKCARGYAVSMNPQEGENRVLDIVRRFPFVPFKLAKKLNIFSLSYDQINDISNLLAQVVGPFSYLSLAGKKDLIMKSSGTRLPLLHIQHGPTAERQFDRPQQNSVHMICAPEESDLDQLMKNKFPVSATASILAHRMSNVSWDFILTSDI